MTQPIKNPHAVALGRRGGKASLTTMTPEERKERARRASQATKRYILKHKTA